MSPSPFAGKETSGAGKAVGPSEPWARPWLQNTVWQALKADTGLRVTQQLRSAVCLPAQPLRGLDN